MLLDNRWATLAPKSVQCKCRRTTYETFYTKNTGVIDEYAIFRH